MFLVAQCVRSPQVAGCVAPPDPERKFTGAVCLTRCAKDVVAAKTTYTSWLVDELVANRNIHNSWRGVVSATDTFGAMESKIRAHFSVLQDVRFRVTFRQKAVSKAGGARGKAAVFVVLGTREKLTSNIKGVPKNVKLSLDMLSLERVKQEKGSVSGGVWVRRCVAAPWLLVFDS